MLLRGIVISCLASDNNYSYLLVVFLTDLGGVYRVPGHPRYFSRTFYKVRITCRDTARCRPPALVLQMRIFLTYKPGALPPVVSFALQSFQFAPPSCIIPVVPIIKGKLIIVVSERWCEVLLMGSCCQTCKPVCETIALSRRRLFSVKRIALRSHRH